MPRHAALRRPCIDLLPYLLILPITLLLVAISFYPSLSAVWLAMTDASLLRLPQAEFVGGVIISAATRSASI